MKWITPAVVLALGIVAIVMPAAEPPSPGAQPGLSAPPLAVCPTEESSTRNSRLNVVSTVAGVGQITIFSGGGSAGEGSFDTGASGSATVPVGEIAAVGSAAALVEFPVAGSATASLTTGPALISAETCSGIPDSQVIVGGGSTINDIPFRLQLMNPYSATASVDIAAFSESGRESSDALRAILVPAKSSVEVDIGSILSGRATLNLVVEATRGSVVTSASTEVGGDQATWRAVAPAQTWYAAFPVFAGAREVIIASSTPTDVAYQIDVFGPGGLEEAAIEGTVSAGGQEIVSLSEISQAALAVRVVTTAPVGVFSRLSAEGAIGIAAASPVPTNDWLVPGAGSGADTPGRVVLVNVGVEMSEVTLTEVRESSRSRVIQVLAGQVVEVELDSIDSDGVSIVSDGQIVPFWIRETDPPLPSVVDSPSWQVSDLTLRLVVVSAVLAVVVGSLLYLRARDQAPSRSLGTVPLDPGVYLFTSAACADCHTARERLQGALGAQGFIEYSWESEPGVFEALSIDKVPSSVTVDETRRATLWIGPPDRMISAVDP